MSDDSMPITNLTVPFQWYQQAKEVKPFPGEPKSRGIMIDGPIGHWEGELYCELINNPRLIAEKIFVLYPPKMPHQGTFEEPDDTLNKLPSILRKRVRFVDEDLKAHRMADHVLKPIKEDLHEIYEYHSPDNQYIINDILGVQTLLRKIIVSNRKKSICDINSGFYYLSDLLTKIDMKQLNDESRTKLNIIKSYFGCYERLMAGDISILKPLGPEKAAALIFQEIIDDAEKEDIISERGKIGQIPGLAKYEIERISRKISNFFKRHKSTIHIGVQASGLFISNFSKAEKAIDSFSSIGLPSSTVPILNLSNSRLYALLNELNSLKPIYGYKEGVMSVSPIFNINLPNFFTLMQHPLTLEEELYIRQCEIEKKDIKLDLFPERSD